MARFINGQVKGNHDMIWELCNYISLITWVKGVYFLQFELALSVVTLNDEQNEGLIFHGNTIKQYLS